MDKHYGLICTSTDEDRAWLCRVGMDDNVAEVFPHGGKTAHENADAIADCIAGLRDVLDVFRESMSREAWGEWTGESVHGPEVRNDKIVAAIAALKSLEGR